ncbi:MAG: primosomal protein N' [Snowella sp.]|jgi:primosomal protein N' (replication factor Y)|nr:MAG: primosomal protein N' [Snowella sp.]
MTEFPANLALMEPILPYSTELPKWVQVLVDCPGIQGLYTYAVPTEMVVQVGDILSVPFGSQVIGGIAIGFMAELPTDLTPAQIKPIEDVITQGFFSPSYWQLLDRVADYYRTELMSVIRMALPPGLLGRSQRRIRLKIDELPSGAEWFLSLPAREILQLLQKQTDHHYSYVHLQRQVRGCQRGIRELTKRGWIESYLEDPKNIRAKQQEVVTLLTQNSEIKLTPRQQEVLEILRRQGGELWVSELIKLANCTSPVIKRLADNGYVTIEKRERLRLLSTVEMARDQAKTLTIAQSKAVDTLKKLKGFNQVLLHGVTGSGKTEVYLQAIAPILAEGKSVLILVPEIGLTPQLTDRFKARFGNKICVYHSALSDGERYDTWRQMLTGTSQVVIGTRSAIFAPLPNLGLIILDEEHDSSFKQSQLIPAYHARTVAQWRAELENCPLILGSATPSLESWLTVKVQTEVQIAQGFPKSPVHYLSLPERVAARPLPPVEIVDMRQELKNGNRSIFSYSLQNALKNLKEQGKQGIIFVNRRGHSTFVSCRSCGFVLECPHCDVSLSYHYTHAGATELLRCHYCNFTQTQPRHCPSCESPYLKFFGSGTQKVTEALTEQFPELSWLRFDSDTTRTKGAHRRILDDFSQGKADLLVGTQMLTKGLDVSQVTLVGAIAADSLLNFSDYRSAERAFQTLTQVAGRAGRGDDAGRVIIQTYAPTHPVIEAVKNHDYQAFVDQELPQRQILNYPPYGHLILIRLSGLDSEGVENVAVAIAEKCQGILGEQVEILGPAPASVMRVAQRFRWHILLKFSDNLIQNLDVKTLRAICPASVSLSIDVDPLYIE